jgi:hypothetical protein
MTGSGNVQTKNAIGVVQHAVMLAAVVAVVAAELPEAAHLFAIAREIRRKGRAGRNLYMHTGSLSR